MRMRDWEKERKMRKLTTGERVALEIFKRIAHGNARHRNWLKRKLIEYAPVLTGWHNVRYSQGRLDGAHDRFSIELRKLNKDG